MGTYGTWEFYETFGGWPEPGETYPDDPDALRDQAEEDARNEPSVPITMDGVTLQVPVSSLTDAERKAHGL